MAFAAIGQQAHAQVSNEDTYKSAVANTGQTTVDVGQNIGLSIAGYQRPSGAALTLKSATTGAQYTFSAPTYPNIDDESRALTLGVLDGYTAGGPALTQLRDLKFQNFRVYEGNGGALFLGGGVASGGMQNVNFTTNLSGALGGGFFAFGNFGGDLTNARFENNRGGEGGGGFGLVGHFTGNMNTVTFVGNFAGEDDEANGGGGFGMKGNFTGNMDAVTFQDNSAVMAGGGFMVDGNFTGNLSGSTFTNNSVAEGSDAVLGGGGFAVRGDFSGDLTGSSFTNNSAVLGGGGFAIHGNLTGNLTGLTFSDNRALVASDTSMGGAGFAVRGNFSGDLTGSTFKDNQARTYGGGLAALALSGKVSDTKFFDNVVRNDNDGIAAGGAIAAVSGLNRIENSLFIGNESRNDNADSDEGGVYGGKGGAVYLSNARVSPGNMMVETFAGNTFLKNSAQSAIAGGNFRAGRGGAIYFEHGARVAGDYRQRHRAVALLRQYQRRFWPGANCQRAAHRPGRGRHRQHRAP